MPLQAKGMISLFEEVKRELLFTGLDPECQKPTAGVASISRLPRRALTPRPHSEEFVRARDLGRADVVVHNYDTRHSIPIGNIYGWTNGERDAGAAARTDALVMAVAEELGAYSHGPKLIVGDLNADLASLPLFAARVDCGE